MLEIKNLIAALVALLLSGITLAHGPYYGSGLLADRERSLNSLWSGSFYTEAVKLVEPPDGIVYPADGFEWRERLDERVLTPAQRELVGRIRAESERDIAEKLAAELPADVAAYTLGARAWYLQDDEVALAVFWPRGRTGGRGGFAVAADGAVHDRAYARAIGVSSG